MLLFARTAVRYCDHRAAGDVCCHCHAPPAVAVLLVR